ncbi:PAS domain S-box protein [Geomonas sp. RF6]|uniref:PAS domain S-box protein n=1 Tax=Geomonas sp. RF6 TaxID=2897342 RepID=UPI001E3D10A3|nr:PAS domain S-box protein [Geomonas sp. RF6]UFS71701.1 PAS domain S-box protein [Geomonas sp. RF6]
MPGQRQTCPDNAQATLLARIEELEAELDAVKEAHAADRRALAAMRETKRRYLAIINSFDGQIYICSHDYRIEFMNEQMVQRTGRNATGEFCYEVLHHLPDVCPWCVKDRVSRGETVRWEVQSPKDGRWYYVVNTPLYKDDGTVSKHAMIQDITERKVAEERRRESEEKYRGIFENAPVGIYQTTVQGEILGVNPMLARLFGYASADEMLAEKDSTAPSYFADPEVREAIVSAALASHGFVSTEVIYRRRDGSTFCGTLTMMALRDKTGEISFLEGFIEDVTLRKKAEEELRKLSEAVKQSPVSITITDADGAVEFVNPMFTRVSGYLPEDVVGKAARILGRSVAPEPYAEEMWSALRDGKVWEGEVHCRKKGGEPLWEHVTVSPIRDTRGGVTHFVALEQDITEQKRIKEQLLQAQKMEAVGQLAGGVAHDFNNILTAIIGFASIMQLRMPLTDPLQSNVEQILAAAGRAATLTRSLLTFSRTHNVNLRPANLNDALSDLGRFLKRIISEEISFRTIFGDDIPTVYADVTQIQQVVINLATNARDEMPKGGVLTLETGSRDIDEDFVSCHGLGTPGSYAVITVSDTGRGMDEEIRKRIFEPFFTTKGVGKGTGLGLSIVYGIVKQHSGFIIVSSTPGNGASFEVFLPAAENCVCTEQESAGDEAAAGGRETILLAEDDAAVRQLMSSILTSYGYRVIVAQDGSEAVRAFEEHGDEVQLLLFDMIMPQMNGKEACEQIRRMRHGVPVLYLSGYTMDYIRDRGDLADGAELLMKPVEPRELLKKVRGMLER